jgi:hypothetical protein
MILKGYRYGIRAEGGAWADNYRKLQDKAMVRATIVFF